MKRHLKYLKYPTVKYILSCIAGLALVAAIAYGLPRGLNQLWNNRDIATKSYHTVSKPTTWTGHVEITRYFHDNSTEVKV